MNDIIKEKFSMAGAAVPEILFPCSPLEKWACIACDQFTSEPGYWESCVSFVGGAPSSLNLFMPEAWLGDPDKSLHEKRINEYMRKYLEDGTLRRLKPGLMYIERETSTGTRRGLLVLLDLRHYEYKPGNKALCRATEDTVEERLPLRVEIRRNAILEIPHAMVLVNDERDILMDRAKASCRGQKPLYDFELMLGGGRIKGWHITEDASLESIADALVSLKKSAPDGMLYAVGDGNHSLAAAKMCEDRYAMAELVNIYDPALVFEPIHRLMKNGIVVDYIHGKKECLEIAKRDGLDAVIMPEYDKSSLFSDVIEHGVLEKKTFSIGKAEDKRFYLECAIRK